ncbi:MAG TPA: chloride channel protein [Candidatus Nitrosocosmicus sp.]|jgi:chloride channel protein, CIC family|nr:chloride channel protein [Candidatus Nitrosocosmicus sp.]
MTVEPEAPSRNSYFILMINAALFGGLSALLTVGYITLYNQGVKIFEQVSIVVLNINIWPLVLLTVAGVLIGLVIKFFGQNGGLGIAQVQYAQTGRINPRKVPSIILQGFISLWSGAPVGPEGPLVFLTGGFGTFLSDRLKLKKNDVQVLVYSSIAGAFGGFFGSPVIGAVGAIEYMFIKELDLNRHLIPGLLAAAVGYAVYSAILQDSFLGIYSFPNYASPRLIDMWWALLVGVIAGFVGIMFKIVFGIIQRVFAPLAKRPVSRAVIGGIVIGLIGTLLPLTLYSGQDQLLQIIHNPAAFGIGLLLLMVIVKVLITSTSFSTGFEGGPIFPLLFIGGSLGLAISKGLTFIPEGIGVTVGMAAVACAVFPLPLTIALLLGFMGGQTDLLPVIVIGAVTGFLISKVITPLLPKPHSEHTDSVEDKKQTSK